MPAKREEPRPVSGAIAKQKTAVPQGAASLSLAVLENDGRKREVPIDTVARSARWSAGRRGENTQYAQNVRSVPEVAIDKRRARS